MFKFWPVALLSSAVTAGAYAYSAYQPQLDASRKQLEAVVEITTGAASLRPAPVTLPPPVRLQAFAAPEIAPRQYAVVDEAPRTAPEIAAKIIITQAPKTETAEQAGKLKPVQAKTAKTIPDGAAVGAKAERPTSETADAARALPHDHVDGITALAPQPPMNTRRAAITAAPAKVRREAPQATRSARREPTSTVNRARQAAAPARSAPRRAPDQGWARRLFAQVEQGGR